MEHSSRKHALLSASGSSRWLNCTPSARLEDKYNESNPSTTSVYAEEGTLAHEFGDISLRFKLGQIEEKIYKKEIAKLRKHKLYSEEMEPEVDKYINICMELYQDAIKRTPDAVAMVEERLDFSHLVEQGFGTGDFNMVADGILDVADLKYGKGVKVDAEKNSQLMLYGSGALRQFEMLYDIHTVRLHIIQPRLDHYSVWEIKAEDLIKWGEKEVKPKASKAYLGEGIQQAGNWCKWCKVKGMCATLAAKNVKLAQHEFKDPHLLTDDQIAQVFGQIPMLVDWANAVGDHMLNEALKGKSWKGYKIVEGRSLRKFTNPDEVMKKLQEDYDEEKYTKTSLLGIGAIEKLVGKKDFNSKLGSFVIKPPGKPTLVPMSDKRPAMGIEQAKEDFNKIFFNLF